MTDVSHEQLLDSLFDGVYYVDTNRIITFWNKAAERITGFTKQEVSGACCADNILRHIDKDGNELCVGRCPLAATLEDGKNREAHVFLHHKDGHRIPVSIRITPVRDEKGGIIGGIEIFSDNSDRLELAQKVEDLKQAAFIDILTGIGNRRFCEQVIHTRLYEMQAFHISFGVILFDVDNFKSFNDTHGHKTGDAVLRMMAKTVAGTLRQQDHVCRWGGEEFIAILSSTSLEILKKICERIRIFIEKSFIIEQEQKLNVTASLGATLSRENDTMESLINRADRLMYDSKKKGRNRFTID